MKKSLLFAIIMLTAATISAQEGWKILLNKKTLLSASEVSEEKNVRLLKSADWKKNGFLEVEYRPEPAAAHRYSLYFSDEKDNNLLIKDSTRIVKVSTQSLRKLFAGKKQIKITIVISPASDLMMAPTRMKHLATLKLP